MKSSIMNQRTLPVWKRRPAWLALIAIFGILCLTVIPPVLSGEATSGSGGAGPEGSWLATIVFPDGSTAETLMSYCGGGAMVVSDPSIFPRMATAFHGTWMQTGRREFVFTMIGFIYDDVEDQYPNGKVKIVIKETDTIEPDGDTYNGTGTVEIYSLDGTLLATYPTPAHAARIKAE